MATRGPDRPSDEKLKDVLEQADTIAVVGLSPKTSRDSFKVAAYLQAQGYRIIPVNPTAAEILGEKCYPDLASIPEPVDVVDVFRRSEFVPEIARQAAAMGAKALCLQEGVVHHESAREAAQAGLTVLENICLMVEHKRLFG